MKCLNCKHWKVSDYSLDEGLKHPETNDAECERIRDLIEIELRCDGYGCGGEYVDEIWTNQDFFCAGFEAK
jgi:translation initiation factor 6 (eIF-6)